MNSEYKSNPALAKKLNPIAWVLTIVVTAAVFLMRYIHLDFGVDLSWLAPFHSTINALTGVVLILALVFVKKKRIDLHRKFIMLAMFLSLIFLVSYVLYHLTSGEVRYCKEGFIRYIYFFILITHIISAAIIFPFVLFTFIRGYTFQVEKHIRMARWVFPVWLYVCITGPITYLMLSPCF